MEYKAVKQRSKKGTITPIMEAVLVQALQVWQLSFLNELDEIKAEGKRSIFHANWSSQMLQEFGISFNIEELRNTQPILED
jgi:hypothetical protein